MNKNKKEIDIIIVGKCIKNKKFKIRLDANIEIIKRLILARLKKNGKTIIPKIDKCKLIVNEKKIILENQKKINYYFEKNILKKNSEIILSIKMKHCSCFSNELEFGSINMDKKQSIANNFNFLSLNSLGNLVRSISSPEKKINKREGWYDGLSWDNNPINDCEWG